MWQHHDNNTTTSPSIPAHGPRKRSWVCAACKIQFWKVLQTHLKSHCGLAHTRDAHKSIKSHVFGHKSLCSALVRLESKSTQVPISGMRTHTFIKPKYVMAKCLNIFENARKVVTKWREYRSNLVLHIFENKLHKLYFNYIIHWGCFKSKLLSTKEIIRFTKIFSQFLFSI